MQEAMHVHQECEPFVRRLAPPATSVGSSLLPHSSGVHAGRSPCFFPPPPPPPPPVASPNSKGRSAREVKPSPPKPDAKKCQEEPKQSSPLPSVRSGSATKPPPPPLPPFPSPPPPPPPLKGGSPAPAPQRQLQSSTVSMVKGGSPLPKLKPLYWEKLRAAPDRPMVWDEIDSSSFELDEEMIKSLFSYNMQSSGRTGEARSKTSSRGKHVLDHMRLQNTTVLLRALNTTSDQICGALLRGTGLCVRQLEALVKMTPTKEEETRLLCFEGDVSKLDPTEKFLREVLSIPFSFHRADVMLYRETFDDEISQLRKSFQVLEEACKELRSSRLFVRLLEAVLRTGNRMNVGSRRGDARAFKLDALLKLADVKSTDGKTTLLHFIIQEIVRLRCAEAASMAAEKAEQKKPSKGAEGKEENHRAMELELISELSTQLRHVKTAAGIDVDALAGSMSNLSTGLERLQHLLERHDLKADLPQAGFVHSMRSFSNYAAKTIREQEEDQGRVLRLVRETTEYYQGNLGKEEANPLGIFVIVRDFLGMVDRVCTEAWSRKGHHSPRVAARR